MCRRKWMKKEAHERNSVSIADFPDMAKIL